MNVILTLLFYYNVTDMDNVSLTYPLMYKPNGEIFPREIFLIGADIFGVTLKDKMTR